MSLSTEKTSKRQANPFLYYIGSAHRVGVCEVGLVTT